MKRATIRHPKLLHLASLLRMPPYAALGLLEALLDWTFDFAREGDVGRFSDAQIAQGIGYPGDPARMICALIDARWLDRCATHRLVVHNLPEHAPESWRRLMGVQGRRFVVPVPVSTGSVALRTATVGPSAPAPTPTPDLLALTSFACAPACAPTHEFDEFWKAYPRKCDKQRARKAWAKLRPPPLKAILDALAWQRELPDWCKENGAFVPYPASYLNGRRWEDERPPDATETFVARLEAKGLV